ncbi:hypothetical protein HWV62_44389 [Athelia sp. TMB]|nr:hypothetical protein HWV62_44389 [Athelia sp. TMB]
MSNTQQKALFLLEKFGDFAVRSSAVHTPGPGELLIKNGGVALNPVDWKIQKYGFGIDNFPAVIGMDLAGSVEEVGEGVTSFKKGDQVVGSGFWSPKQAAFQQYTVLNAKYAAKVMPSCIGRSTLPESVSAEQASSLPIGLTTAAVGLYQKANLGAGLTAPWEQGGKGKYAGKPFIALGGSSSVGAYVLQLAKLSGFSPIITTASSHNAAYLESLGATHVLDRHLDSAALQKAVASITELPVDVIYDTIAEADTQKLAYELLSANGTLIVTGSASVGDKNDSKTVISTIGSPFVPGNGEVAEGLYANLETYLDTRAIQSLTASLQTNQVEVLPGGLEGIVGGLERLREGKVSASKLVVRPQETP